MAKLIKVIKTFFRSNNSARTNKYGNHKPSWMYRNE